MREHKLYVEKYRSKVLDEYVGNETPKPQNPKTPY